MGTISRMIKYRMEHCQQKLMKLGELTQPDCGDAAAHLCERDENLGQPN